MYVSIMEMGFSSCYKLKFKVRDTYMIWVFDQQENCGVLNCLH